MSVRIFLIAVRILDVMVVRESTILIGLLIYVRLIWHTREGEGGGGV